MTDTAIVAQPSLFPDLPKTPQNQPNLHTFWLHPERLPASITQCASAMRTLALLGPLHWDALPDRTLRRHGAHTPVFQMAYIAAALVKLNEGLRSFESLYQFLWEHPAFRSLLEGWNRLCTITFERWGILPAAHLFNAKA